MSDAERFDHPFLVLELPATATRAEIERAGAKWLAMLELGHRAAAMYSTPVGPRVRTPELVRAAMAELRDPERRAVHELWWSAGSVASVPESVPREEPVAESTSAEPFDALAALGWIRR